MPSLQVRDAHLADSDQIARLVSDLGYPTSPGEMRRRLEAIVDDESYQTLVALNGADIVGFVGTRIGVLYENDDRYGRLWVGGCCRMPTPWDRPDADAGG
jgi:hypothetical protein